MLVFFLEIDQKKVSLLSTPMIKKIKLIQLQYFNIFEVDCDNQIMCVSMTDRANFSKYL
jgi:hypothetical protein